MTVFLNALYITKEVTYDVMMCLLTAVGLTPGGSSTVHIYTQTIHRTTQLTNLGRVRAVARLRELYPGICLTTEEKHGKISVRVAE